MVEMENILYAIYIFAFGVLKIIIRLSIVAIISRRGVESGRTGTICGIIKLL